MVRSRSRSIWLRFMSSIRARSSQPRTATASRYVLGIFSQDRPRHLGEEPLGLQHKRVDLRRRREDVGMDHIPEAFLQTQHAVGFLLLEDLSCFLFYLFQHLSALVFISTVN